jgi:5-amino-6-(5-phosphoribosylamino)uracil reductase
MSVDGYIDDSTGTRLLLSNDADLDRVDAVRAGCDAILVGANTIRQDNPRLTVRSAERRDARVARGLAPTPVKVTLSGSGNLDPSARFFTEGVTQKIVFTAGTSLAKLHHRLGKAATVADGGDPVSLSRVLADLTARGIGRLMVEGGSSVHTAFLSAGLADELQLVVAPFFVGDPRAPRFVGDGSFPWAPQHPARLAEVCQIADVVLLRYALSGRFSAGST